MTIIVGIRAGCVIPVASDEAATLVVYDFDLEGIPGDPLKAPEVRKVQGELAFTESHDMPVDPELTQLYARVQREGGEIK